MNLEIGSYEAKIRLPELLRGIQAGNRYTITLRGKPVADLIPAESSKGSDASANLARRYKLSAYDAAYLELALRRGLPLATLDGDPEKAARKTGVKRFESKKL